VTLVVISLHRADQSPRACVDGCTFPGRGGGATKRIVYVADTSCLGVAHSHVRPVTARQALRGQLNTEMKRCGIATRRHPREQEADAVLV